MNREFRVERHYSGDEEVKIYNRQVTTMEGDIALRLAEHWGMVAAEVDGEDSAGRAKVRRMTPAEIAAHACDTAAAFWEEFEKRGWKFEIPMPRTEEQIKAEEKAAKAAELLLA